MASKAPDSQESVLDQFVTEEKELTPFGRFTDEFVHRAPWWAMSLVVHVVALWIMFQWPVSMAIEARGGSAVIDTNLITEKEKDTIEPAPPPDDPEPLKDNLFKPEDVRVDVPIEDVDISDKPFAKSPGEGGEDKGVGVGRGPGTSPGAGSGVDLELPQEGGDTLAMAGWRPVVSIDPPSNTPVWGLLDPTKKGMLGRGIYADRGKWRTGSRFVRPGSGPGDGGRVAESCVNAGLIWLAKAQAPDGHWDCKAWDGSANYDVGMTGLALLAFLGAGYTHTSGKYREVVGKGLDWLRYNQKPNGAFGYLTFYEQGIATIAVSEAYGLTRSETVRTVAQKAVDFIVQTQPDHGGFRYQGAVAKEEGDMSVTGWQIMAIKSAICSELTVPMQAIDRSREFLKNTLREYGGSSYLVSTPNATAAMTAIGMLSRQFLGGNCDAEINAAANWMLEQEKKANHAGGGGQKDALVHDLYYTYYSTLAMFQMGGEYWNQWNRMFRDPLVKLQETKSVLDGRGRFVRGSWDPKDTQWGAQGGRVFSTAMAVLCLEVYYRFLPVYKRT